MGSLLARLPHSSRVRGALPLLLVLPPFAPFSRYSWHQPMLCILQARMSSARLPSKMLLQLINRPLLGRTLDRLGHSKTISSIVVATSDSVADEPIADFCAVEGVACFRGSPDNVAERFRQVLEQERAAQFVRISGDSPLIDPALVDQTVRYFWAADCDLATNIVPRTFPKGQSVEVLLTKTFLRVCNGLLTGDQREHVTKFYYENPADFRITSFTSGGDYGKVNLSIDTAQDLARVDAILDRCGNRPGTWSELALIAEAIG